MPQNIQLQQVVVNLVIIKMRRNNIRRHIIGRMLYRSKRVDFLSHRKYNDTTRMLSGRTLDAGTSNRNTVNFTAALGNAALFKIFAHKSICRLIRYRTNGSRTVRLSIAKDNLSILMRLTLIFIGEV